ncbi:ABC transporter ATP-binding protein [Actinoplanes sp. SE50]|uniref:dipeptide ABC transporter ATP-binding protein n=1 Tax=unclassified Actinoplanes TaxID=2626549 RepID=UPI00023EC9E4|nr:MULTISPECIES: ABC transporter ATP-binding protein [unclassified Actinoplanes]AEV86496.1 Ribose import ATP-binding protein rbsA [Actinoplanes sp. SE50/110]ATO84894.1 ABC transporter ATP-binding protein [Actinoplanes sp. SE50]SLM02303.1 ABC transporter ATP-binding protein [Actinoplanes sp. SE50/110]
MTLLTVTDLKVSFGDRKAVDGLSFAIPAGGSLGIVGESGSGKSTAALALLGLTGGAVSGRIDFGGTDLVVADPRPFRGARIAMVFQEPLTALNPFQTVGSQIAEVYRLHTGASRREARARAVEVLGQVHIPDPARRAGAYPHEFSGGMRQRALIAMAIACRPELIVADEPTTALDVTVQAQILDLLDEVRATTGAALLLISHDLGVVAGSTEQVVVMRHGTAVETGATETVLRTPRHAYTRALLDAAPRPGGRVYVPGAPLLELRDVHKHFKKPRRPAIRAVDGVTVTVHAGETLGVVGESGTGKTTLARMMVGLVPPTSGTVTFDGVDIARRRGRSVQMVFQDPLSSLNPRRTVGESIADPLRLRGDRDPRRRVCELLERVGLSASEYDRYPHQLSGGMRQRVGIARAVAPAPRLIVCDEPVSSLDVTTQAQVLTLLEELRAELGLALVFVSHDLAVLRRIADRIAVLKDGRVVEIGPTTRVYEQPEHPYTEELLAAAHRLHAGVAVGEHRAE